MAILGSGSRRHAIGAGRDGVELAVQRLGIHGLDQVAREPGLLRLRPVLGKAVTGERHQPHVAAHGMAADAAREFVAVHAARQADVDEGHVERHRRPSSASAFSAFAASRTWWPCARNTARYISRESWLSSTSSTRRDSKRALRAVAVQAAPRRWRRAELGRGDARQAHRERRAAAIAVAGGMHAAAVHFGQPLHQREADAQAAARAVDGVVRLHEQIEDLRQHLRRDADALVDHAHHGIVAFAADEHAHRALALRELERVRQQVADDLLEAHGIAVHPHGLGHQVDAPMIGSCPRRWSPPTTSRIRRGSPACA